MAQNLSDQPSDAEFLLSASCFASGGAAEVETQRGQLLVRTDRERFKWGIRKAQKKKKQPQRGLGVAQLERIRLQEQREAQEAQLQHHRQLMYGRHPLFSAQQGDHMFAPVVSGALIPPACSQRLEVAANVLWRSRPLFVGCASTLPCRKEPFCKQSGFKYSDGTSVDSSICNRKLISTGPGGCNRGTQRRSKDEVTAEATMEGANKLNGKMKVCLNCSSSSSSNSSSSCGGGWVCGCEKEGGEKRRPWPDRITEELSSFQNGGGGGGDRDTHTLSLRPPGGGQSGAGAPPPPTPRSAPPPPGGSCLLSVAASASSSSSSLDLTLKLWSW